MNTKKLSTIQNLLDEMCRTKFAAGANCLIIKDGIEQGYYQAGYRNIESGSPIERDSLFRLYSMSKTVTAVATMILVERGVIDLHSNVSKYLTGFSNPTVCAEDGSIVPAEREVRIIDLLSMTSGVQYPGENNAAEMASTKLINEIIEKMDTEDALTTIEIANRAGRAPLAFNPGSKWQYGFSADILGAIIEVASGQKLGEFLSDNIFRPLGMVDTAFFVPKDKQSRLASVYEATPNKDLKLYTDAHLGVSNHMKNVPAFESGGAGLCASIDDFVPFTQMLINNGVYNGVRILSKESVKYISTPHLHNKYQKDLHKDFQHLSGHVYSNLMRIMTDSSSAMTLGCNGEYGWDGWLGAYMSIDPTNNLTILFMTQLVDSGTNEYTRRIRNVVYSALD